MDGLCKGNLGAVPFVDAALEASNVTEETTLMREQIKGDEATYKQDMIYWYLEDDMEKMTYSSHICTCSRIRYWTL